MEHRWKPERFLHRFINSGLMPIVVRTMLSTRLDTSVRMVDDVLLDIAVPRLLLMSMRDTFSWSSQHAKGSLFRLIAHTPLHTQRITCAKSLIQEWRHV